jgi:membrane-associated phospholipid phosphatase
MAIHQLELNGIKHLQDALRSPFTDTFFIYWNYVDTAWFVISFVAIIMYLFNRKEGISLLFIFIISGIVNLLLKGYFDMPRPCHIDPSVGILFFKSSGFPSGAAQTATIIAGVAFAKCRRSIYKMLAVIFALFVCFSRVYLGLHYFTDILGGIAVGIGLLAIYVKLFPLVDKYWEII